MRAVYSDKPMPALRVESYLQMLEDIPTAELAAACRQLAQEEQWFPPVAVIRKRVRDNQAAAQRLRERSAMSDELEYQREQKKAYTPLLEDAANACAAAGDEDGFADIKECIHMLARRAADDCKELGVAPWFVRKREER